MARQPSVVPMGAPVMGMSVASSSSAYPPPQQYQQPPPLPRFDPNTGQPIVQAELVPLPRFDPNTGQPIVQVEPPQQYQQPPPQQYQQPPPQPNYSNSVADAPPLHTMVEIFRRDLGLDSKLNMQEVVEEACVQLDVDATQGSLVEKAQKCWVKLGRPRS